MSDIEVQRPGGILTEEPTTRLRWNGTVLEQMWTFVRSYENVEHSKHWTEWRPVPHS